MSFKNQTTVSSESNADKVKLMFDFEELGLLMADFKDGFKNTTEVTRKKGSPKKGGGFEVDEVLTTVRDYDYYRANELWEKIADELDIDMDADGFDDDKLSEMYSFAYDQNEEYENPTYADSSFGDDDEDAYYNNVPTLDVSYSNKYTDEEKALKPAFSGNHFKIGDSMSLNLGEGFIQSGYMMMNPSGLPEDSGFKGNTNSLHN